ncbi:MAG: T9SS type A sorting domain-containing protein [Candidatus Kapabacteria bacterium]|nr:T9SS type A sorting domain-containing protein [Candidatus Kapabacteria bacterium]
MRTCTRPLIVIVGLLFAALTARASTPTWSNDVGSIIYKRCGSCHVSGGIAPFTLASYDDAVAMNFAVMQAVRTRSMPPWPPAEQEKPFAHSRSMTEQEIAIIEDWVLNGMPRGDSLREPEPPRPLVGSRLPVQPDWSERIPSYTSRATSVDVYQYFPIRTNFSTDRYVRGFEVLPGDPSMVHHALIFVDTTGTALRNDAQTPNEPGFPGFGGDAGKLIGVWAPGAPPLLLPDQFGFRLPKGATIVLQIHYPAGTQGKVDSTRLNLVFTAASPVREVLVEPLLNHVAPSLQTGPFILPPNRVTTMRNQFRIPFGVYTLLGVAPHMHLLGTSIAAFAVDAADDTTSLVSIPEWDFHWQGNYLYRNPIVVRGGTMVHGTATYDNTTNNKHNPSSPPREVRLGEATTDEMFLVYFMFTPYRPGDESLDLEALTTPTSVAQERSRVQLHPNPASSTITIDMKGASTAILSDMMGRIVKTVNEPNGLVDISDLPNGSYIVRVGGACSMLSVVR